jgi:hypothetical protein
MIGQRQRHAVAQRGFRKLVAGAEQGAANALNLFPLFGGITDMAELAAGTPLSRMTLSGLSPDCKKRCCVQRSCTQHLAKVVPVGRENA